MTNKIDTTVNVVSCAFKDVEDKRHWRVCVRVIDLTGKELPNIPAEGNWFSIYSIIGSKLMLKFTTNRPRGKDRVLLPNVTLGVGNLARIYLDRADIELVLDKVACSDVSVSEVAIENIYPCNTPCVRVPLSLLEELRGQEAFRAERARAAIIETWKTDRHTGRGVKGK